MAATIPADIVQFYGYIMRAAQKLLYLYGFPQIGNEEGGSLDTETINTLILCLGVMYGVAGARNGLLILSMSLAAGVEKKLGKIAITKGAVFPIIKNIMKWFNVKLTRSVFTGSFKKSIPLVGGIIGGTITYMSFKPCCNRLKASLQDKMLNNPDKYVDNEIV